MRLNQKGLLDLIVVGIVVLALGLATYLIVSNRGSTELPAADSAHSDDDHEHTELSDLHGIAVDIEDQDRLYLANHDGLYVLEAGELTELGDIDADIMGLAKHPIDPNILYASGHPRTGGNLGLLKSTDGGRSWQQISEGLDGPVDFHLIAVDRVNPDIIYGMHAKRLQKSTDGGKSWSYIDELGLDIYQITTGRTENSVYLSTPKGIKISRDGGNSWQDLSSDFNNEYVTTLAVGPASANSLLSFSNRLGLAKSDDDGKNWASLDKNFKNDTVVFIEFAEDNPNVVYLSTESLKIYKSIDGGIDWNLILEADH